MPGPARHDTDVAQSRFLVVLLCCVLLAGCSSGEKDVPADAPDKSIPVELTARVDRAKAKVGEPVIFRVTLQAEPGISVDLPEIGSRIQGFRIVDMGKEGPKKREGRVWSQRWYELKADFTGSYVLPAVSLPYTDPKGDEQKAETKQVFVEVESVLDPEGDEKDIRDLKPLEKAKMEIPRWWVFLALGVLVIIGLLVALAMILRRRKRTQEAHRTPEEIARHELEDLEATGLLEEERYREYVFGLSLIFRRYLERKFHLPAAEQTTEEILVSLRQAKHLEKGLKEEARSLVEETDPIKYRGLEPRPEETDGWRDRLISFLEQAAESEDIEEAA